MDDHPDAIRFLSSHPAFVGVEKSTVRILASRCRPKSGRPGETLFLEGDPCRDLYMLVAGRVKCFRSSPDGREQILKIFDRPGDMFCTTSAFSTGSHIVTAEAMSTVRLYLVDVDTLKHVAIEQPAVALAIVKAAGDQMSGLVSLADDLALKTATARVAKLRWERACGEGQRGAKNICLRRAEFREDEIAAMVGTVRVHVSRSLKTLAAIGAITLDREAIRISDLKALGGFLHAIEAQR